jgi:hypothetical protein
MIDVLTNIYHLFANLYHLFAYLIDLYWVQIVATLQAIFCGGCAYQIAFKFRRGTAAYRLLPSMCAFGLASLCGQQWLSIVGRVLMYGNWPVVSFYNTMTFAILFILLSRARGNVSKMFTFQGEEK